MRVHRRPHVVRRPAVLHREHHLGEQVAHVGPDHVAAEDLVGLRVGHELHEALRAAHRAGAAVRAEGELADLVGTAALLHLRLGEAAGRDLRPGVDHPRHVVVVHVRRLPRDHLGRDHAFVLGLVREELPADRVADGEDVREVRAHLVVHDDLAALAEGEAER